MSQPHKARSGSMQVWPRKRAGRIYPRVHTWASSPDCRLLGFAGYKVAMGHAFVLDTRKTSRTKNEEVAFPVTIVECPPLKLISARFYKNSPYGKKIVAQISGTKLDKEIGRKIPLPKKDPAFDKIQAGSFDEIRGVVATQPKMAGIGKKKPEIFEVAFGGKPEQQLEYVKQHIGKDIPVTEVFKEGQMVDVHAVTKGHGIQGPVKRFGVSIRQHKAEKTKRGPGSLGAWKAQGHMMYRVAHAGQMGFHTRTEYNKVLIKIDADTKKINRDGGFKHYGVVKAPYVLLKGSIGGASKRLVRFNHAIRNRTPLNPDAFQFQRVIV